MHAKQRRDRRTVRGLLVPLHTEASGSTTQFALMRQREDSLLLDESFLRVNGTGLLRELGKHLYRVVEISGAWRENDSGEPVIDVDRVSLPGQPSGASGKSEARRARLLKSRRFGQRRR